MKYIYLGKKLFLIALFLIFSFAIILGLDLINKQGKRKELHEEKKRLKNKLLNDDSLPRKNLVEQITSQKSKTIFVPEWQINHLKTTQNETERNHLNEYQRVIYFGSEKNFAVFYELIQSQQNFKGEVWFALKITQVSDEKEQFLITKKTVDIVKNYNLQGVALDLEINSLPTDDIVRRINNFVQYFQEKIKSENLKIAVILYGDTFYRSRPFDVKFLAEHSDEVMIMAYDFHKSYGQPGPNFPFEGKGNFGYDFKTMIDDFLKFVKPGKLTVIFGMYGYDWQVDEKKRPIKQAKALTTKQIKEKFLTAASWQESSKNELFSFDTNFVCFFENCLIKRDEASKEIEINYVISSKQADDQGIYNLYYHIVWFEDEESVKIKTNFLKEKGIGSIAYWAWGYF